MAGWESLIWECKMKLFWSNICLSSSIREKSHGLTSFGIHIIIPHPHKLLSSVAPFGGAMCSSYMKKFCLLATPQVHAGDTVVFWLDRWQIDNRIIALKDRFPRLHSFAIDDTVTVKDFFSSNQLLKVSIYLSLQRHIWNWFSYSHCYNQSACTQRRRMFGNGHLNLESSTLSSIMSSVSLIWGLTQFSNTFGIVPVPTKSRFLVGFFWWID